MKRLACFLLLSLVLSISAQENDQITIGSNTTIKSSILGEDRRIFISLPAGYQQGNNKYPVLYILDGERHFHYASGIINYLSFNGKIPHMIVVGIPNTNRDRDFTHTKTPDHPQTGGSNNFISFMDKELIPYINSNYRTTPYKILFGHSLTAMFSVYTMLTYPELFNAYIAASPYLMYDNNSVVELAKTKLPGMYNKNQFLYVTIGNEPEYYQSIEELTGIFKSKSPGNFKWSYIKTDYDDHATITVKTLDEGIKQIYEGWSLPAEFAQKGTLKELKSHYEFISEKFEQDETPPEAPVNFIGYQVMGSGRIDEALKIFEYNIENYPNSANVYDSYGECLEAANKFELAMENYEKAVKLGKETNDPNTGIFEDHLEKIKGKLQAQK